MKDKTTKMEKLKERFSIFLRIPQQSSQAWNQELHPSHPHGLQGPNHLGHLPLPSYVHSRELDGKQRRWVSGTLIQYVCIASGGLAYCAATLAPQIHVFGLRIDYFIIHGSTGQELRLYFPSFYPEAEDNKMLPFCYTCFKDKYSCLLELCETRCGKNRVKFHRLAKHKHLYVISVVKCSDSQLRMAPLGDMWLHAETSGG